MKYLASVGLKVLYDIRNSSSPRVVDVQVRCAACSIPKYSKLDLDSVYAVLTSEYMINGGDGFTMLRDNLISRRRYGNVTFHFS